MYTFGISNTNSTLVENSYKIHIPNAMLI